MIRAYNTLDKIDEIFDDGDFNINKWEKYINSFLNNKAHMFKDDLEQYVISGQYSYEEDFLPLLNNVYHHPKLDIVIDNFQKITERLDDKVKQHFKEMDVDIYLYLGLLNGAGWATIIDNRHVILLGIEKILELDWTSIDDMYGLIYHELGHIYHMVYGNLDLNNDSFIYQLYYEGIAMHFEQLLKEDPNYFHQDKNGYLSFCEDCFDMIKTDFKNDLADMDIYNQRYFGDWTNYYGYGDVGYYLGAKFVDYLANKYDFDQLINLDHITIEKAFIEF